MRCLTFLSLLGILTACAQQPDRDPPSIQTAFDPAAAAYVHKRGSARIDGQAFVINRSGKPLYAAGETIRLVPATSYARARFARLYGGRTFIPASAIPRIAPDPEYARYTRTTVASATGRFIFEEIAPGEYFITAQKIHRPKGSFVAIGGAMYTHIKITGREQWPVRVVVAGK